MSEALESDLEQGTEAADDGEVVDALPVLATEPVTVRSRPLPGALARSSSVVIPAVQAAAVAAGGFVAGAAVVGLVQRRHRHAGSTSGAARRRGSSRAARSSAGGAELVQIVSSRSLLVDVHLLGPAGQQR